MSERRSCEGLCFLGTALFGLSLMATGFGDLQALSRARQNGAPAIQKVEAADLIITNGRVVTQDDRSRVVEAAAVRGGRFVRVGSNADVRALRGANTRVIDLGGRTVVPGLNDSHTHVIRGGLHYNLELRWDGVPSLREGLRMIREQAARTPAGQWVRVVGGWSEFQFTERRLPTLAEINDAAPTVPVFVLHLYGRALVNRAGLRALGITRETPDPPGGEIERDAAGDPTGLLLAKPGARLITETLAKLPRLSPADQRNSMRQIMREFNRLGLTSAIDAGGGGQSFPDDYQIAEDLARRGELTLRISYHLAAQQPGKELADYAHWRGLTQPGKNLDRMRPNGYELEGAGENLVSTAGDFENFLEPRPELPSTMEAELKRYVTELVRRRWPFRIHATYDESVTRILNVFEEVNRETPFDNLRFFLDHCETISDANLDRLKALGGISVQDRMALQGEHFVRRYGAQAARSSPPIKQMLARGIPVGMGTDATRVSTYNPWVALYWLVSGKTVGGTQLYPPDDRLTRAEALRLYTEGSAWFSGEEGVKGRIAPGQYADFAVLSADYFAVPEEEIKTIESVLTVVGGDVVYGAGELVRLAPQLPPVSPAWSPAAIYGGYYGRSGSTRE